MKNVYNKFSVRFFIRFIFHVKVRFRMKASKPEKDSFDGEDSEEDAREAIDSDFENIESYMEQSEISSNFLEVNFWR